MLPILHRWTSRRLRLILESNGRRPGPTGACSTRLATIEMVLKNQLETKGPGWYSLSEREERLFTNRSNRPGDDMKDDLRSDGDPVVWQASRTTQNQLWQLWQPAPPLEFPGEQGIFIDMYTQVREEEQVISPQFTCKQEDVFMRRRKKRKQVEDGALTG